MNTVLNTSGVMIGNAPPNDGWHGFFNGLIDEAQIYNRALTAAEVLAQYNAGSNGVCAPAPPTGSIALNPSTAYTNSTAVNLDLTCSSGSGSGCSQMQFSNDGSIWSTAEAFATTKAAWALSSNDGLKTVSVMFQDAVGTSSAPYSATITLDTTAPTDGVLTASPFSATQINLTWTAATDSGTGLTAVNTYTLARANGPTAPVDCSGTAIYQGTAASFSDSGRTVGAQYSYRVCATDAAGNVSIGATAGTAINKADAVISWPTASAITYGQTLASSTLSGGTSTPAGTFAFATPTTAPVAGTAAQSVTFTPNDTANYNSATSTVSVTVNKATPVITWANPAGINFGTALSTTQLNATSGGVAGTFVYTPVAGTVLNPGAGQMLSVTFTPTDTANYNSATSTVSVTVNKATPVITWANPAGINFGTALSTTQLNATSGGVAGTFVYTPAAGTVLNPGAGQTLSVTFTPTDTANYNSQSATTTITVIDTTPPDTTFTAPATAPTLAVAVTLGASDAAGVTGYLLKDSAVLPLVTDPGWTSTPPSSYNCRTWGNNILYAYAKDAAGNISDPKLTIVLIGPTDGIIVPAAQKLEPTIEDALKSLNFAMKVMTPTPEEFAGANVSPLVNGIPQPPGSKTTINLGDTIVTLRRVIGL